MIGSEKIKVVPLSALVKLRRGDTPVEQPENLVLTASLGERVSFQLAIATAGPEIMHVGVETEAEAGIALRCFEVCDTPVTLAKYPHVKDGDYISGEPGLYPDRLRPMRATAEGRPDFVSLPARELFWSVVWVDIEVAADAEPGRKSFRLILSEYPAKDNADQLIYTGEVEVLAFALEEQSLIRTEWFHTDCLASYYNVEIYGERHWEIIAAFMRRAAELGINMILTPIWTPPLDTAIGHRRPNVQLVDIRFRREESGAKYSFDFNRLRRWVALAEESGLRYFEMAHMFTQWGAKAAPQIWATEEAAAGAEENAGNSVNGGYRQIFGWETPALGEEYIDFLRQFLPALTAELDRLGIADRCYFHISDEPGPTQIEQYKAAKAVVQPYLKNFTIIDALSDFEFYRQGVVEHPIPSTNHAEPFYEAGVKPFWVYYCCGQAQDVSNRFLSMPSARTRALGFQLYKYNVEGFLQWGYNFYYSHHSLRLIDPYTTTDADFVFPGGDPFLVYPGADGEPEDSIRARTVLAAMKDLRACQQLERRIGREAVLELLEGELAAPLSFMNYPRSDMYYLQTRNRINRLLVDSDFQPDKFDAGVVGFRSRIVEGN